MSGRFTGVFELFCYRLHGFAAGRLPIRAAGLLVLLLQLGHALLREYGAAPDLCTTACWAGYKIRISIYHYNIN